MRSIRLPSRAILGAAVALLLLVPAVLPAAAQDASVAPPPAADGQALAEKYMDILALPDAAQKQAELQAFLGDEFQVVRASGPRQDKAAYLVNPPTVHAYTISDVVTTQDANVAVVSYLLNTTETIDNVEQTHTAPRLSVFHWNGTDWELIAHSNFGAIDLPAASPAASPAG
ncbi:MAG: nuclear transport factor 2 family protein [Chloroflexota bacterium]